MRNKVQRQRITASNNNNMRNHKVKIFGEGDSLILIYSIRYGWIPKNEVAKGLQHYHSEVTIV